MLGKVYDLAVIGGGLNGTAIARDAAGRGLSVFLCEAGDLGGASSSATGKIVHGGLRLLEGFRFGAMREAVEEREILMRAAPHLVRPLTFHIPHHSRLWPERAFRAGLFAYDHVARCSLPRSRRVDLEQEEAHGALDPNFEVAFAYSDCIADDSRLVVLNAVDARSHGAAIRPRVRCTVAERDGGRWRLSLESTLTGEPTSVQARILVNAAGAQAGEVANHIVHGSERIAVTFRRRSHLVVRGVPRSAVGYALPNEDGRIVYVAPYGDDLTLIGAAVGPFRGNPATAAVSRADAAYLLDVAGQYLREPPDMDDVVWAFASVSALPVDRNLVTDGRAVVIDAPPRVAPLVSVYGGTLTGHRRLAEQVVDRLGRFRKVAPAWTASAVLPGGGFPAGTEGDLVRALRAGYPFLAEAHARRLTRAYGTRASAILLGARKPADLGARLCGDLTAAEARYLRDEEWAVNAEDILWRRTKLGLTVGAEGANAVAAWLAGDREPALSVA